MPLTCDNLIKKGLCHGDCCGIFPIKQEYLLKLRHRLQVTPAKVTKLSTGLILLETEDIRCAFMNRSSYRCNIYEQRPLVCRDFGNVPEPLLTCPWITAQGERRTRAERRNVYRGYTKARKHGNRDLYKGGIKV